MKSGKSVNRGSDIGQKSPPIPYRSSLAGGASAVLGQKTPSSEDLVGGVFCFFGFF
jgi:hypothetical protein